MFPYANFLTQSILGLALFFIVQAAFLFIVVFIIYKVGSKIIASFIRHRYRFSNFKREARAKSVTKITQNLWKYTVGIATLFTILTLFGIDTSSLLLFVAAIVIAAGIGAQTFIRDMIGGYFILLEGPFSLHDHIIINEFEGTVVEFGLRTTVLQDNAGRHICIGNGRINSLITYPKKEKETPKVETPSEAIEEISPSIEAPFDTE